MWERILALTKTDITMSSNDIISEESLIFGVGLHKTGTTSVENALKYLGYQVKGREVVFSRSEAKRAAREYCQKYDALLDMPWPVLYKWLDKKCPNSKFILTTRPVEKWIDSVCGHFGDNNIESHKWIYGVSDPIKDRKKYIGFYRKHNKEVKEYFGDRRGSDLFIVDIESDNKWDKLCRCTGDDKPLISFPKSNARKGSYVEKVKEELIGVLGRLGNSNVRFWDCLKKR